MSENVLLKKVREDDLLNKTRQEEARQARLTKERAERRKVIDASPEPMIDGSQFDGKIQFRTFWPPNAMHRLHLAEIPVGNLPADVLDQLKASGLKEWLSANPAGRVQLGESVCLSTWMGEEETNYGARRLIPVREVVALTLAHTADEIVRARRAEDAARGQDFTRILKASSARG